MVLEIRQNYIPYQPKSMKLLHACPPPLLHLLSRAPCVRKAATWCHRLRSHFILAIQMKTPRSRSAEQLAQGHAASKGTAGIRTQIFTNAKPALFPPSPPLLGKLESFATRIKFDQKWTFL